MTTINKMVRNQILAEAPQMTDEFIRERYIERTLHEMSNSELLERISDALEYTFQQIEP